MIIPSNLIQSFITDAVIANIIKIIASKNVYRLYRCV